MNLSDIQCLEETIVQFKHIDLWLIQISKHNKSTLLWLLVAEISRVICVYIICCKNKFVTFFRYWLHILNGSKTCLIKCQRTVVNHHGVILLIPKSLWQEKLSHCQINLMNIVRTCNGCVWWGLPVVIDSCRHPHCSLIEY